MLYVANVDENQLSRIGEDPAKAKDDPLVAKVAAIAEREGAGWVAICSKVEAEIQQLPESERADYLGALGLSEPGLHKLARKRVRAARPDELLHRRARGDARLE